MMEGYGRHNVQERVAPGVTITARCASGAQGWTLHVQTPSERSQGEMERAQRLRCGKQTKTEWWDTERLDQ